MHLNRFDLNLLIALDALLHEKNVTRAAERLFVSQPAMSAALQKLREYFDDPLLVRAGREMNLTPRGLSLVEPVREALLSIQATLGTQASFDPITMKRAFTAIVTDHAMPRLAPRVLERTMHEAPGVTCAFEQVAQTSLARIEYGDADLGVFIDYPRMFGIREYPQTLRMVELAPVRWVCMMWKEHPEVADELTEEQYVTLPHLIGRPLGFKEPVSELVRYFFKRELNVRATAQSLSALPFMLPGTSLIATVPEAVARRCVGVLPVKALPPPYPIRDSRELLVWHSRNEADPGHAWLRNLFITAARTI